VKDNVYEPLVMNDPKGEIHPWLAEKLDAERKFERVDVQDSPRS
jgi:ABC-type transport system substrate-binding protein